MYVGDIFEKGNYILHIYLYSIKYVLISKCIVHVNFICTELVYAISVYVELLLFVLFFSKVLSKLVLCYSVLFVKKLWQESTHEGKKLLKVAHIYLSLPQV